ncbi:hypothetical protein K8T06_16045, partial [bacterium]|nr:hypothetical protein [bacterium]
MNAILKIGFLDLKLLTRDVGALLQMFVFPILFTFVFGLTFSSSGTTGTYQTGLIVQNNDEGPVGAAIISLLPEEDIQIMSEDEAGERAGRLHKLIIPATFTHDIFENSPGQVELVVPEKARILATQSL